MICLHIILIVFAFSTVLLKKFAFNPHICHKCFLPVCVVEKAQNLANAMLIGVLDIVIDFVIELHHGEWSNKAI